MPVICPQLCCSMRTFTCCLLYMVLLRQSSSTSFILKVEDEERENLVDKQLKSLFNIWVLVYIYY